MRRRRHGPRARALRVLQEVAGTKDLSPAAPARCFVDLHCHTSASFDSLSRPEAVVRAAVSRGLTHLAITDHERIDGALAARDIAPPELSVIIGEEIRTANGDLIGLYLEKPVPAGRAPAETAKLIHEQGGVVGLPHPFDRFRNSAIKQLSDADLDELMSQVDYIEVFNARLVGRGNQRAAELAAARRIAGAAVSDAHTVFEVAVSYTAVDGPVNDADDLRRSLVTGNLVMSRGSYYARATSPLAKLIQRWRGNVRQLNEPAPTTQR